MKLFEFQALSQTVGGRTLEFDDINDEDWTIFSDKRLPQVGVVEAAAAIAKEHFANCSKVVLAVRPKGQMEPRILTCSAIPTVEFHVEENTVASNVTLNAIQRRRDIRMEYME